MEDHDYSKELEQFEKGKSVVFTSDSGLSDLNQFKKEINDAPVPSRSMWRAIKSHISEKKEDEGATVTRLYVRRALMIAAAVMLALISFFNIQLPKTESSSIVAQTKRSYKTVTLDNQAVLLLRNYSNVNLIEDNDSVYRVFLEGELHAEVKKRTQQYFEIETGTAVLRVLGTQFTVRASKNETIVYLEEGSVEIRKKTGDRSPAVMQPGEIITVTHDEMEFLPSSQKEVYTAWMNNEIVLQERTLDSVADELQRHYNIIISLPTAVKQEKLSGVLPLGNLDDVFKSIETVIGGKFTQTSERVYHWRKREF